MASLEVKTSLGPIKGIELAGGKVRGFLGIQTGTAERWKKPVPAQPHGETVKDASKFGPGPPKLKEIIEYIPVFKQNTIPHSENCLYANVWTPSSISDIPESGLPVMVWIHGGALSSGETQMPLYDGTELVKKAAELGKPVVLVSINYRLNIFGYLASAEFQEWNEDGSTGNLGFYDQRLGLKWVKDNIKAFGGNPDKITVFGESAGAVSTDLLSIAFGEEKLFSRAILQSGTAMTMPAQPVETSQRTFDQVYAAAGGPADLKGKAKVEYLLTKSTQELLDAYEKCRATVGFAPVIDGVFLKSQPAMAKRHVDEVLLGTNKDEGTMFAQLFLAGGEAGGRGMIAASFPKHSEEIIARYTAEYGDFASAFDEFFNDAIFHVPTHGLSELLSAHGAKVYRYRFEHPLASSVPLKLRVHHAAEIAFVFHQSSMLTEQEIKQAEEMVRHWATFAHEGHPGEEFPAYHKEKKVLVYTENGKKIDGEVFRKDAMEFWGRVFAEVAAGAK